MNSFSPAINTLGVVTYVNRHLGPLNVVFGMIIAFKIIPVYFFALFKVVRGIEIYPALIL